MEWIVAALLSATFFSILNVVTKKLTQDISGLAYNFIFSVSALILLLPVSTYLLTSSGFNFDFLPIVALIGSGVANTFGIIAYNNSIKQGEISEVIPLTKLTPTFTAVLGFAILGEKMTVLTVSGILAVTFGSYIVLLRKKQSFVSPLKRLFSNRSAFLAALSSVIYAFASIMDRFGTQAIPPGIYVSGIFLVMSACFTSYLSLGKREKLGGCKDRSTEKAFEFWFGRFVGGRSLPLDLHCLLDGSRIQSNPGTTVTGFGVGGRRRLPIQRRKHLEKISGLTCLDAGSNLNRFVADLSI